jgi:hypothetical protein
MGSASLFSFLGMSFRKMRLIAKNKIKANTLERIDPVKPSMYPQLNMPMINPPFSKTS